jgi:hypothetical protein
MSYVKQVILLLNIKWQKYPYLCLLHILKLILDLFKALCANTLTVEEYDVVRVSAENARGRILLKNDSFVVNKDLNGILYVDIERTADLDRKNNSAELINAAYYTCRFHSGKSS